MNVFYKNIMVDGIQTLIEFHYDYFGADEVVLKCWYDRHGDEPDLTATQEQNITQDIRQFESQRPLQNGEQIELGIEFQFWGKKDVVLKMPFHEKDKQPKKPGELI